MKSNKMSVFFLLFLLISGSFVYSETTEEKAVQTSTPLFSMKPAASQWSEDWYMGASGYAKGSEEFHAENKPMVVYVSVGWCPYCRKFEKGVLSSPIVKEFLQDKIKVNINPEASQTENAIAFRYGVTGFPSLYVHLPRSKRVMRLYPGGTPQEFIEQFQEALK